MSALTLQRNVQFMYEEQLARVELQSLGCERLQRHRDNPWRINAHVNGTGQAILERSAYVGSLDGVATVYDQLVRPGYQGGEFNRTRSINQYLTHWIYPYRGKFHPQMVRALLNILGVTHHSVVLDPYMGSGTTALESALIGAASVGIDVSPLCVLLTRVKTQSVFGLEQIRARVEALLKQDVLGPHDSSIASDDEAVVRDFVTMARLVTFSDISRRNRDGPTAFRKNLQAMLASVEAHAEAIRRFEIKPGRVVVSLGDARDLGASKIGESSIDAVVTSPPYSIALDYAKNDQHALEALGIDLKQLRSEMTGVRGRGPRQKLAFYNDDMKKMFGEVARVMKPGAKAAFVIGNATVDGREYTTTEQMADWAVEAGLKRERELLKIVFGLYNVMSDEKILIFRKP